MLEWEAAEKEHGRAGEERHNGWTWRQAIVGRESSGCSCCLIARSSHHSVVFNCTAHTPPWILHSCTIGLLVLPHCALRRAAATALKHPSPACPRCEQGRPHSNTHTTQIKPAFMLFNGANSSNESRAPLCVTTDYNKSSSTMEPYCWRFSCRFKVKLSEGFYLQLCYAVMSSWNYGKRDNN